MLKQRLILITLLITFLSSCQTPPTIRPTERCVPVLLETQTDVDGKVWHSGYCRCNDKYVFDKKGIRATGQNKDFPLEYCNKMIGWRIDWWNRLWKDFDEFRVWLLQQEAADNM